MASWWLWPLEVSLQVRPSWERSMERSHLVMRLGFLCLARSTFDVAFAQELAERALRTARATGLEIVGDARLVLDEQAFAARLDVLVKAQVDALLVIQATFSDASMICRLAEAMDRPIAIWGFPEARNGDRLRLNSFCGVNLAAHALGLRGRRIGYLYAPPDHALDAPALLRIFHAAACHRDTVVRDARNEAPDEARRVLRKLQGTRLGLVGRHPPGFDTCRFDEEGIRRRFGVEVRRLSMDELFQRARACRADNVARIHAQARADLVGLDAMEAEPLDKSFRAYAALREFADEAQLGAIAVRCWPETFTAYGCAVCGAMARLNEERVPAACEADTLGALTTFIVQELGAAPALLVDVVDMDARDNTMVVWHCGLAPLSMCDEADTPRATIHSNRKKPLLHEFALKPGRITLARLSQARGRLTLAIGRGHMIRAPRSFSGTAGVLRPDAGTGWLRDTLIDAALEHHFSIVYGDVKAGFESIAAQRDIPVLDLDGPRP